MRSLFVLWFAVVAISQVHGQLDTLYFDDFLDSRGNWETPPAEGTSRVIRDGFLEVDLQRRKGHYALSWFEAPVAGRDSFVYEIKLLVDSAHTVGAAYLINHAKERKNGSKPLCCYQAVVANPKDVHSYFYSRGDGGPAFNWMPKAKGLDRKAITFRLTYGPSGKANYYWNGKWIHGHKMKLRTKHPVWGTWGFVSRGNARFKVDYVVVMARKAA